MRMPVAREGLPFILVAWVIVAGLALASWWVALALWLPVAVWVVAFFRDPVRTGPRGDAVVIAPADGKVVSVIEMDEPTFLGGRATRISIFMNVFNVHVNHYPASGTVAWRAYLPGRRPALPPTSFHQLKGFNVRQAKSPCTSRFRKRSSYSENSLSP